MNVLQRLRAWYAEHQRVAIAGGVAAVGGFALWRRHVAGSSSTTAPSGASGSNKVNAADVAGIAPATDTSGVDQVNAVLSGIDDLSQLVNARLPIPKPTTVTKPKPPTPLPAPGSNRYTIRRGDTLGVISREVYGEVTAGTILRLKAANPTLATFGQNSRLDYYAGHTITIPRAPTHQQKPPKKAIKPPRQRRLPQKPHKPVEVRQPPAKTKRRRRPRPIPIPSRGR